jgi:ribosomal RNA large subunit methyltransferase H
LCGRLCRTVRGGSPGSSGPGNPDSPDSSGPGNPAILERLGSPDGLERFGSPGNPDRLDSLGRLGSPGPDNPDSPGRQPSRPENSDRPTMNIDLLTIGKTDSPEVAALVAEYARRINFYCRFTVTMLPDVKRTRSLAPRQQCVLEGEALLRQVAPGDCLTLLDERGAEYRSVELAGWLQKRMLGGTRRLVLAVGGPYGFSDAVYARADARLSLSKLTFSHQIVRVLLAEQLYRAFTILNNEPYHHE